MYLQLLQNFLRAQSFRRILRRLFAIAPLALTLTITPPTSSLATRTSAGLGPFSRVMVDDQRLYIATALRLHLRNNIAEIPIEQSDVVEILID